MNESQESLHFLDYWRVIRARKEIVLGVSLLVALTGVTVTHTLMPRVYMASTVVQVTEESPDVDLWARRTIGYDPLFLRTQFQIIQSRPIVEEVIQKLELNEILPRAYGYAELAPARRQETTVKIVSAAMKTQQHREAKLIEIRVFLRELGGETERAPELAARIANEVAAVYKEQKVRRSRETKERALEALRDSLDEQTRRVAAAEEAVEKIREKYKLSIVNPTAGTAGSLDRETLRQLEAQRIHAKMELASKESRYREIANLSTNDLLQSANVLVGDVALQTLVSEKRKAQVELSQRLESYGPKHPEVIRVETAIRELEVKIQDALEGMKTGVKVDYEAEKAKYNILEKELDAKKEEVRKADAGGYREFEKAVEELEHVRKVRDELEVRHQEEKIELRIPKTTVEVVEPAVPASVDDPVSPRILLNTLLSILAGLGAGMAMAFFVEYLDTSVKTIGDVERLLGTPVLAVIPQRVKPLNVEKETLAHSEPYRLLRTNIQFSKKAGECRAFCFTSGGVGEGKSLTLFNLAYVCAQLGEKVVVVDSDLHRPRQHRFFGVENEKGLANVLAGEMPVQAVLVPTAIPNLHFVPSGRLAAGVHGLMDNARLAETVRVLKCSFDRVFFDAPPVLGVSDALLLAREVDVVLLVVQHRKYPKAISIRAKEVLDNAGVNVGGVILNKINMSRDYSHYYYYYTSYYADQDRRQRT